MLNNMAGGGDCCLQKNEYWVGKEKDKKRRKKSLRIVLKTRWRGSIIKIFFFGAYPRSFEPCLCPPEKFSIAPCPGPYSAQSRPFRPRCVGHNNIRNLAPPHFEILWPRLDLIYVSLFFYLPNYAPPPASRYKKKHIPPHDGLRNEDIIATIARIPKNLEGKYSMSILFDFEGRFSCFSIFWGSLRNSTLKYNW